MKLETFFERFDQFADAPDAVAKMRELILKLAMQGRLATQCNSDEPATVLIAELKNHLERVSELRGKRAQKPLPNIAPTEIPFELAPQDP